MVRAPGIITASVGTKRAQLDRLIGRLWQKRKARNKMVLEPVICDDCNKQYGRRSHLIRHVLTHCGKKLLGANKKRGPATATHSSAPKEVPQRRKLNYLSQAPEGLPNPENPWLVPSVMDLTEQGYDPDVVWLIRENWRFCCTSYRNGRILKRYNIRLQPKIGLNVDYLASMLRSVHENQPQCYKINFDFALILHNQVEKKFRFYWSGNGASGAMTSTYWDAPVMINSGDDLEERISLMDHGDLLEYLSMNRPDSKWTVHSVVNFHVSVFTHGLSGPLMGHSGQQHDLPEYLKCSKSVRTLFCDRNGKPYDDSLCFFRCLQCFFSLKKISGQRMTAKQLAQQFAEFTGRRSCANGVRMNDMLHIEKAFKIRIFIYSLQALPSDEPDPDHPVRARAMRTASGLRKKEATNGDLYLDLHTFSDDTEHLSLITKFSSYSKWFHCGSCGYGSMKHQLVQKHEKICKAKPQDRMRSQGGGFKPGESVFDQLESLGFSVEDNHRYYPWPSCFDIETMDRHLPSNEQQCSGANTGLRWETTLELISIAVASTVPQFTEPHFMRRTATERELVDRFVDYMVSISEEASRLNRIRLASLFESIETRLAEYEQQEESANADVRDFAAAQKTRLTSVLGRLNTFADSHTFYAFNGGRFDVKVLRNNLWNAFLDRGIKFKKLIKRNGAYILASTEKITLKDASCFVCAGTSLDGFVKSYGLPVAKQPFCYDYITSLEVLDETELPSQDKFYSTLKQSGISDEDYEQLKMDYKRKKFSCLWEWLAEYNLNDVTILLEALKCLMAFWRGVGLDVVSEAVTLPTISTKLMHKMAPQDKPPLWIPSKRHYDIYQWLQQAIVGGPSIVFRRLTCVGVTHIRDTENLCRKQLGFDANSLYLWCMEQPMPCSLACKWKPAPGGVFKKEFCLPKHVSVGESEYMQYLKHSLGDEEGRFLFTYFQNGQVKLGKNRSFSADAISFRLGTVWSFDGCFFHFCDRCPAGRKAMALKPKEGVERRELDKERNNFIENINFRHVIMRECEWHVKRLELPVRKYLARTLYTPNWNVREMTGRQLLRNVEEGHFFGLLEVDIECPESLKDYFAEFPAVFLNIGLDRQHLSGEMLEFAERNDLVRQPRRCLVSVRSATSVILTSPLLRWMLKKGLKCTKLHYALEFKQFSLFKSFCGRVIKERSSADADPSKKPIGDSWKLRNSAYGRTLMSTDKFTRTTVCSAERASSAVNLKSFRQLEPLSDDQWDNKTRYELTMLPPRFTDGNPRYLGVFILGFAKLRMLQFYYDFLRHFWSMDEFELTYMDTDSLYLAIASATWEEHETKIKPGMRAEYERAKVKFLTGPDNKRQPGLFKVEYECEVSVALSSKTYCLGEKVTEDIAQRCSKLLSARTGKQPAAATAEQFSETVGGTKVSSKGTNKKQNPETLRLERFLDVLETREPVNCCNRGFRCVDGRMYKYSLTKAALGFFYGKRKVRDDFGTEPLW